MIDGSGHFRGLFDNNKNLVYHHSSFKVQTRSIHDQTTAKMNKN